MYDLNKVMLIGRLTKDPEITTTQSGKKVASFSIACTMSKNKDTGESKSEFINCIAWESLADILSNYAKKGAMIYVEGSIQTRSWDGENGKKNYKTEVLIREIKLLSSKNEEAQNPAQNKNKSQAVSQPLDDDEVDIDINIDDINIPF